MSAIPGEGYLLWLARQHWIRRGIRERTLRLSLKGHPLSDSAFTVTRNGMTYEGTLANHIDWDVFFYGCYEPEIVDLFGTFANKIEGLAIDVGANTGHHTIMLSRCFSKVEAFEPWEPVRSRLSAHLVLNDVGNVTVHPVALGERQAKLPFHAPPKNNLGQGSLVAGHAPGARMNACVVPVVNGDDFLAQRQPQRPDLIKIDVEGYEKSVLRGLQRTLETARPTLIVELSGTTKRDVRSEQGFRDLFPSRYEFFGIQGRTTVLWIFEQRGVILRPLDYRTFEGNVLALPVERLPAISDLFT
jgi:FkbM family methyltransferase